MIPRRWAVERTFAWLTAHRRLARGYERDPKTAEEAQPPDSNAAGSRPLPELLQNALS